MLDINIRLAYWRSLLYRQPEDQRLVPGHLAELRSALRDAIEELERVQRTNRSLRWRDSWTGTLHPDRLPSQQTLSE